GNSTAGPDVGFQIPLAQAALLQAEQDRVNRVRWPDGVMLVLVLLDQDREHFQFVRLWRPFFRCPQLFQASKGTLQVGLGVNRLNVHHIVSASTLSYWPWVPTNRTQAICLSYRIAMMTRYLFPPMLKTARPPFKMLAVRMSA